MGKKFFVGLLVLGILAMAVYGINTVKTKEEAIEKVDRRRLKEGRRSRPKKLSV